MENTELGKWKVLFKSLDFFKPFDDQELDILLKVGNLKKFPLHEFVIKEDRVDYSFYVILRGQVSIIKNDSKSEKRSLASLYEGDCFGEIAILLDGHRSASVMTSVESYLFILNGKVIEKVDKDLQIKLFRQFAIMLASRLKASNSRS